ncbi:MAG TPA: pyridoxamine 5'-phosphate oxidase family protein, partial [Acidimicrobiia bacterium]|nr:pyridoxamine 5'-phosphate oxidase family protein [Acidimicrobiia bacterium]
MGRRIEHRRQELGLSHEELSLRSGMAVGYLRALERRPTQPTSQAVLRLAAALETTAATLLGVDAERAVSRSPVDPQARVEDLSREDARQLLAAEQVGRVVLDTDHRGPVAIPVNFLLLDGHIVIRTARDSTVARAAGNRVGFEVDHLDPAMA